MGTNGTSGNLILPMLLALLTSFEVGAAPVHLTFQGRIVKPSGEPLQYNNVSFLFEITSPNGACVLYREQVDGINMQNSNGIFDVPIGSSHSYPTSPTFTVLDAFNNSGSLTCYGGAPFTSTLSTGRLLRVQFHDGASWKLISPDTVIRSVPYAGYAESSAKLGTYLPEEFVRKAEVNGGTSCQSGSFLTWDATSRTFGCAPDSGGGGGSLILNGQNGGTQTFSPTASASSYGFSSAANVHTFAIPSASTAGVTAGTISKTEYDTFNSKQAAGNYLTTLSGDVTSSGYSAGTVTTSIANNAVTTGKINNGAVTGAKLEDVAGLTAGTYPKVTVDIKGRVTSGTTLSATDIPALDAAKMTSGVLDAARLGTGTADTTKFLRGDGTWQSVSVTESDPKVGANTTNYLSKWNGTALITSGVFESSGSVGIGTATPTQVLDVNGNINSKYYYLNGTRALTLPAYNSIAIGQAMTGGGTPGDVVAIGDRSMQSVAGAQNVAVGSKTLFNTLTGTANLALGYQAGYDVTTGQNNIILGPYTTTGVGITTGTNNILIGTDVRPVSQTANGQLNIGNLIYATNLGSGATAATGNVGIGTTTPADKLDVAGKIRATHICASDGTNCKDLTGSWGSGGSVTSVATGTGLTGGPITTSGTISLAAGGVSATELAANAVTTVKILDANVTGAKLEDVAGLIAGSYGSGTSIPAITVDAKGRVTSVTTNSISGLLPAASGANGKYLKSDGTSWAGADIKFSDIKNGTGTSAFNTGSCAANQTVKWSSLTDMFECQNIGSVDTAAITTGTFNTARLGTGTADNTKYLRGDGTWQTFSFTESDPKVGSNTTNYLSKWDGSALVASGVFESSGSVGIGTATPANVLHIQKNGDAEYGINITNTSTGTSAEALLSTYNSANYASFGIGSTGNNWASNLIRNKAFIYGSSSSSGIVLVTDSTSPISLAPNRTEALRVTSAGDVGIGTTTPGAKLEVAGQVKITGGTPGAGKVLTSDAAGLATWATPSGGSGTVTSVTAGTGLTGGTFTTTGTIGLGTELTGLNGLSTTGFVKRTGAGTYSTSSALTLTTDVTGVLPIANGGTNSSTTLNNNRLMASVSGAIQELGALGDGQLVVGKNASAPQVVTLGGDATISNTGSLTIGTGAVNTGKILDGTVGVGDLNFAGSMTTNTGLVVRDGTQFYNKACSGNQTLIWSVANGWICSAVTLSESDPKVGSNTTNYVSKWNGTALVASGIFEDGTGNVGIGTATPGSKLDVESVTNATSGKITSANNYTYSYPSASSSATYVGQTNGTENGGTGAITGEIVGQINWANNGGSGALNKITGSWSGTKNTAAGGTIDTAVGIQGAVENESANAIANGIGLYISVLKSGTGAITNAYGVRIDTVQGTSPWSIYAADANAPSYFAGNIGIGLTAPTSKLEIVGGSAAVDTSYILNRTNSASTKYTAGEIKTYAYNNNNGNEDTAVLVYTKMAGSTGLAAEFGAENFFNTKTYFDGTWSYFRRGGNDAYGTWIYGSKYRGTYSSKTAVQANDDMLNLGAEGYYNATNTNFGSYITFQASENYTNTASGSRIIFGTVANGTTTQTGRMTIENNGNVAIGMTPGSYKFQVNGSVAGTGAYNAISDRRMKRNIATYENGLDTVLKLRGVTFDWRRDEYPHIDFDGTHDVGVIAQEVERVVPEAVHTADDGYKTVGYSKLISPIIQAIHELYERWLNDHKTIEQQQAEIDRLKAELEVQKKDMQEIKKKLGLTQ